MSFEINDIGITCLGFSRIQLLKVCHNNQFGSQVGQAPKAETWCQLPEKAGEKNCLRNSIIIPDIPDIWLSVTGTQVCQAKTCLDKSADI